MQGCASSFVLDNTATWLWVAPYTYRTNSGKKNQVLEMHLWKGEFLFFHGGKTILDSLQGILLPHCSKVFLKDLPRSAQTCTLQKH